MHQQGLLPGERNCSHPQQQKHGQQFRAALRHPRYYMRESSRGIRCEAQGKRILRLGQAGMAELANALNLGTVLPLPAPFEFAVGGGRRRVYGTGGTLANSSDTSQSQSAYYRTSDGGKVQSNKRVNRHRKQPPEEYKGTTEQHRFR
jgi:hypothetical protein